MPTFRQSISHAEGQAKRQYAPVLLGFFVSFVDRKMWSEDGSTPAGDWDARRSFGFFASLSAARDGDRVPRPAATLSSERIFWCEVEPTNSLLHRNPGLLLWAESPPSPD